MTYEINKVRDDSWYIVVWCSKLGINGRQFGPYASKRQAEQNAGILIKNLRLT
jgi:hypothetical protein